MKKETMTLIIANIIGVFSGSAIYMVVDHWLAKIVLSISIYAGTMGMYLAIYAAVDETFRVMKP